MQDLTGTFGGEFASSPTTASTTHFLTERLQAALATAPPPLVVGASTVVDIPTTIPAAVAAVGDPSSPNKMNFNVPSDIAGNLAGGICQDQLTCRSGAQPSPHNDERNVTGTALVTRTSSSTYSILPSFSYNVKDTIDVCPGDCGTAAEQLATVPISQWEATGISGDVPFTIDFSPISSAFEVTTVP